MGTRSGEELGTPTESQMERNMSKPQPVICVYRVKKGKEGEFEKILRMHAPTLKQVGLLADQDASCYQGTNQSGEPTFVEMFTWKNQEAADIAHQTPEVMQLWEPMGDLTTGMEFIHVEPLPTTK